jgi:hypothetical protein
VAAAVRLAVGANVSVELGEATRLGDADGLGTADALADADALGVGLAELLAQPDKARARNAASPTVPARSAIPRRGRHTLA